MKRILLPVLIAVLFSFGCELGEEQNGDTPPGIASTGAVSNLTAEPRDAGAVITWTDPAEDGFDHVEITWTPDDEAPQRVDRGKQAYTATGLVNGTAYTVTVKAVDSSGIAAAGVQVTVTPAVIKDVATGAAHTLFLKTDGTLWAVGSNKYGQLGDGTTIDRTTPVQIMTDVKAMSAGANHSLIMKRDGNVWATGDNSKGQLGDGTTTNRTKPRRVMSSDLGPIAVAAGCSHSLVLTESGVYSTGDNSWGQLGEGTMTNRSNFEGMFGAAIKKIFAGCNNSFYINKSGLLRGTGSNAYSIISYDATPMYTRVMSLTSPVVDAAFYNTHALILDTFGRVCATGCNMNGELGIGSLQSYDNMANVTPMWHGDVVKISVGYNHSLIVISDGTLWAAGDNRYGQLGDGTTKTQNSFTKVMDGVRDVRAGNRCSFIFKTDGTLWAVGNNEFSQLGDDTAAVHATPFQVVLPGSSITASIRSIAGGRTALVISIGAIAFALCVLGGIAIYRRRRGSETS